MVKQARIRNAAAIKTGHVDLRQGTVEDLPFSDNTFNKVLAVNSMQVWADALAGLGGVLKPAATLGFGFTAYSGQSKPGLTELLAAAGFTTSQAWKKKTVSACSRPSDAAGAVARGTTHDVPIGRHININNADLSRSRLAGRRHRSFVSFWKSVSPGEFQTWFASHSHLKGAAAPRLEARSVAP